MTGSERGPQLQQPFKPCCMASAQDTVVLCMATRCRQPRRPTRKDKRPALSATRKNTSRANQRRALGRTLLRLATPPPPPAVVPVRIQHTLHQRGLEGWHGPAACVRGQREFVGHGGDRASPSRPFITPSPTSAREPPADANRRELGKAPSPPPSPPSPLTRWATPPQDRCTPPLVRLLFRRFKPSSLAEQGLGLDPPELVRVFCSMTLTVTWIPT